MHIVLIETSGNQRYIFATNKLRENVGASELTYGIGTELTLQAVDKLFSEPFYIPDVTPDVRTLRRRIEHGPHLGAGHPVEVIVATSGKALLLVQDEIIGEQIIREVTEKALRCAPGVTVHGTIVSVGQETAAGVHTAIGDAHEALERVRYDVPGTEQRFLRLPFVEACATSGLPAQRYDATGPKDEWGVRSAVTLAKRQSFNDGQWRIESAVHGTGFKLSMSRSVDMLERRFDQFNWLAVIHADGNGIGNIFLNFVDHAGGAEASVEAYIDAYRRFSLALDTCTENAFAQALQALADRFDRRSERAATQNPLDLPVVPLVLGGDDLTVLCDGRYAVRFTCDFLRAFEDETRQRGIYEGIIPQIAQSALGAGRLSSCAGIAVVKPHFPFHAAYELAEALLKSAKQVKQKNSVPSSALDYHLLYDASGADLQRIRDRLKPEGNTYLVGRPYVVTPPEMLGEQASGAWVSPRLWQRLEARVEAMQPQQGDGEPQRALANTMLHTLREGLFLGREAADARMQLVRHRYPNKRFGTLLAEGVEPESLFRIDEKDGKPCYITGFLDALDLLEFWQ